MPVSVIIPAHNEAAVIGRCLTSLTSDAQPGELEVIVICNGCKDQTADIARRFPTVKVLETDIASKSNALNLGDAAASAFPRFFVDADVVMPLQSLRQTADVLREGEVLAAAPRMTVDLNGRSWFVRAFYEIWQRLPYLNDGMIGSGTYGVSEQGRRRFDRFPAITADDAFVRLQFSSRERKTIDGCSFTISPPKTLHGVVKIKTRGHFGNYELRSRYPRLFDNENAAHGSAMLCLAKRPALWPKLLVYAYVRILSRLLSYRRFYFGNHRHWERDDSSRLDLEPAV